LKGLFFCISNIEKYMSKKKEETASFVMRLSQKIYKSEEGESQVQWRGHIRHVQSGDEARFSAFEGAAEFVQNKLSALTLSAIEDHPEEDQKGILTKSFDFWKKITAVTPKEVMESLRDPKKTATHLQEQLQEQLQQLGEQFSEKMELDNWLPNPKAEHREIMQTLDRMSKQLAKLEEQVQKLAKEKKK
jgi:hypothetical protein